MYQCRGRSDPSWQGGSGPLSHPKNLVSFLLILCHTLGYFPHLHGESWGTAVGLSWCHLAQRKGKRAEVDDN